MSLKVNSLGVRRQVSAALANEYAQPQDEQYTRCPQGNRFGVVSGTHKYYEIIYRCGCLPVLWVINPETGDRIEEVKA